MGGKQGSVDHKVFEKALMKTYTTHKHAENNTDRPQVQVIKVWLRRVGFSPTFIIHSYGRKCAGRQHVLLSGI